MKIKMTMTQADNPYDVDFFDTELSPNVFEALKQAMAELRSPEKQASKRAVIIGLNALLGPDIKKGTVISARQFAGVYEAIETARNAAAYKYHLGFAPEDCAEDCVPTRAEQELLDHMSDDDLLCRLRTREGNIYADLRTVWPFVTRAVKYGRAARAVALAEANGEHVGYADVEALMQRHVAEYGPQPE